MKRGCAAFFALCALSAAACSSDDSSNGTGGGAGMGGSPTGTGGAVGTGGGGVGGTAGAGTGGSAGTGGTAGSGGAAMGGSTGAGGATEGGAAPDGSGDTGAAGSASTDGGRDGGSEAGASNCAGNAISLSANGTGAASDAAHARVMVDLMTDLPIGNAPRTLEFWAYIKPTDWAGDVNTLFEYGTQGATAAGFGLDFGANTVTGMATNHATIDPYTNGGFDNDSTAFLGITSAMTQWVHFAMVWTGTNMLTYVNGALRITTNATGATTMLATQQTQLTIGCNNPRFACFNGLIDDFRVWNVARAAGDIMANYNLPLVGNETGLVGYWKFDEAPGAAMTVDSVTSAGHTAHPGTPMATAAGSIPTFVTADPPAPILCR